MTDEGARYRCRLCGEFKETKSIAQTHVKHDHHLSGYDEINASIEERED